MTMAMAPTATVRWLTPPWKAGVTTLSVARPRTTVPPTAMNANSVAPVMETAKGFG
jgi:hypothetical protein